MGSRAFQASSAARALMVASVGAAVAAATAGAVSLLEAAFSGVVVAVPTLVASTIWARALSAPPMVGARFAWRSGLAVALAIANTSVITGLLLATGSTASAFDVPSFVRGALVGAVAVTVWAPALGVTLLVFGLPLSRAHALARRGLDGEDRGRTVVGAVCAAVGLLALLRNLVPSHSSHGIEHLVVPREGLVAAGHVLTMALASCAVVAGALGVAFAQWRRATRDALLADVTNGKRADYRVELSAERRLLVRVQPSGQAYRASDVAEEVFLLDSHVDEMPRTSARS